MYLATEGIQYPPLNLELKALIFQPREKYFNQEGRKKKNNFLI
jgi:hypothetical protein